MKTNIQKTIFSLIACLVAMFTFQQANAQKWTFSSVSAEDKALLDADADWILGTERYCYVQALDVSPLKAGGQELAYAKGLKFTAAAPSAKEEGKAKIRLNYGSSRLEMNGGNVVMIIPGLKAGQKVTLDCMTGKNGVARGFDASNLTPVSGSFNSTSTERQTNVGIVEADGDVTLTTTAGMYVYSLNVEDGGDTPDPKPDPSGGYHNVTLNTGVNQMRLTLKDNSVLYYNTSDVAVGINKATGVVTVKPNTGDWVDEFNQTVSNISFAKAASTGSDGTFENPAGKVEIIEAKGWQESAYIKWKPFEGATSYNVYVKGGKFADYTKLDDQLVRNYGTYGRADAVGLLAADGYQLKVVPVADKAESTEAANEATGMSVKNYDRAGFASLKGYAAGAYNNDGTLKEGAKVLYVTKNTAKTIKTDVTINDKTSTFTGIQAIISAYQKKGVVATPLAFRFVGLVTKDDLDAVGSSSEGLQIKGANGYQEMNITIEGIGDDATVHGFGFLCRNAKGVEFRNLAVMRCMDDCISLDTENSNIWIHNMDFFYGPKKGGDQQKGDGTVDLKGDSQYITISYNRFWDTGKSSLCGMTGESQPNYITYHHNWFDHTDSRTPRVRTMSVHVWNNYFDGVAKYGVGSTTGSSVFVESNYFRNTNKPMMISLQGSDIASDPEGTFAGENGGIIKSFGNVFAEKSSNFRFVTYQQDNVEFDAYEATSRDEQVPSTVTAKVGGSSYDNFDTNSSLMYAYTPDAAADVPSKVTGFYGAGRINHGDFYYDLSGNDNNYDYLSDLGSLLDNYKSSLIGIFGDENSGSGETGGGETGGGTTDPDQPTTDPEKPIDGTVTCSFDENGKPSNDAFTVVANPGKNKGTATVDGVTYSTCIKLETATSIKFTTSVKMKMTLYFGSGDTKCTIKIDGQKAKDYGATIDTTAKTLTAVLEAGEHELTKQDSGNLFFIKLEPVAE